MQSEGMKLEEIIISGCRAMLLVASIFGLFGWVYLILMMLSYQGIPRNAEEGFLTFFPLIYFSLTIYGCWWVKTKWKLIVLGITLNLPLAVFLLYRFIEDGEIAPGFRLCLAFIAVWSLLCVGYAWFRPSAT
jgi:hypothetical protein